MMYLGGFADEHRIFVDDLGLIETLPLPGSHRRWMVQTPGLVKNPDESSFLAAIQARTGLDLTRRRAGLLTGVEVPRYLADSFHKGRAALAGDAAHSVTPLGGRGLNQAFLDARDLAGAIHHVSQAKAAPEIELGEYTRRARARAEAADQWAANACAGRAAGGRTAVAGPLRSEDGAGPACTQPGARIFRIGGSLTPFAGHRALTVRLPAYINHLKKVRH